MPIANTRLEAVQLAKLLQCVRNLDKESIEKLIINGIPDLVNYIDAESNGDFALGLAAQANAEDTVGLLLDLGADPDVVDLMGRSAVMKAAEYGHWQSVERLAKAGANMGLMDIEGKGVLFFCIMPTVRHGQCANIVLQHKADPNNTSKAGVPILVFACETARDNVETCLFLLKVGADPSSINKVTGRTAVMAAALSGSAVVVKEILDRGGEVNGVMKQSNIHAAHEAAKGGFLDVLQVLSGFGGKFEVKDNQGNSPIHLAAMNGHGLACRFLAQRGCNPKSKNSEGQTARLLAKSAGHKEALRECRWAEKFFGKSGKNIEPWAVALYDLICVKSQTLMEAFQNTAAESNGKVSTDDFLHILEGGILNHLSEEADLKKIISLHSTDGFVDFKEFLTGKKFTNKQYQMAAYGGRKKPKEKRGGKGKAGKTKVPFPICTQSSGGRRPDGGPPSVYLNQHVHHTDNSRFDRDDRPGHLIEDDSKWYLDMPGEQYSFISHAVKNADINTLRDTFQQKNVDVDIRDKFFKTPLMIACLYGNMDLVKFLTGCGASVAAQDNFKWTPLHFACHCGVSDVVEYLLNLGANIEAKALNGTTPLMRAIQSNSLEIVQLLLQRGAKLRVENRKQETPVDIAAAYADYNVYSLIKERWDSLPPIKDKRKTKPKRSSSRPRSTPANASRSPLKPLEPVLTSEPEVRQRKTSILRTSSALGRGIDEKEDITYSLVNTWDSFPTSRELMSHRQERRERFGWEADFEDVKFPFLRNVSRKIEAVDNKENP